MAGGVISRAPSVSTFRTLQPRCAQFGLLSYCDYRPGDRSQQALPNVEIFLTLGNRRLYECGQSQSPNHGEPDVPWRRDGLPFVTKSGAIKECS